MGSWRFVLSRRWVLFAVVVVFLAYACWWLGGWQFGRLHDRKADNAIIRTNEHRAPTPIARVAPVGGDVAHDDEWRLVTATGTYDPDQTVVVRYQTDDDGVAGVDVVVPLVTGDGTAVLVDRGWVRSDPSGAARGEAPDPPTGQVTVTGYLRQNGSGSSTSVDDHSTRAISSTAIGPAVGLPVYGGFVDLRSEDPRPTTSLEAADLPELDNGPHFFYGLQWWFFGVLAVFGFFYLMYDERLNGPRGQREAARTGPARTGSGAGAAAPVSGRARARARAPRVRQSNHPYVRARQEAAARAAAAQSARDMPPSTGSIAPETNDDADDSRKAAARPNSAGSP